MMEASAETSTASAVPRSIVQIAAGLWTTCVVFDTAEARCWGSNLVKALGENRYGDDEPAADAPDLPLAIGVTTISIGRMGACAVTVNNELTCWGSNEWGQLGYPNETVVGDDEDLGKPVALGESVAAVAMDATTCVISTDGEVRCFGANGVGGSLGLGISTDCYCLHGMDCCIGDDEPPTSVPGLELPEIAKAISVGIHATCVVMTTGELRCWGGSAASPSPAAGLPGLSLGDDEPARDGPVVDVGFDTKGVATRSHTCAVSTEGLVRCWGRSEFGALGQMDNHVIGDDEPPSAVPPLPLPRPAEQVVVGSEHSCARLDDGSVWCWGSNVRGQIGHPGLDYLGDDEPIDASGPVDVGGAAVALAAGNRFTCALLDTGRVRCWGANSEGQLGYGHVHDIGDNETPADAGDVPL